MLIKFYHLRTKTMEPRLTRCVIKDSYGNVAIGTSLCSMSDNPEKRDGRMRAFGRAMDALRKKKHLYPISREEAIDVIARVNADSLDYEESTYFNIDYVRDYKALFFEKGNYSLLNEYEKKLIKDKKDVINISEVS